MLCVQILLAIIILEPAKGVVISWMAHGALYPVKDGSESACARHTLDRRKVGRTERTTDTYFIVPEYTRNVKMLKAYLGKHNLAFFLLMYTGAISTNSITLKLC